MLASSATTETTAGAATTRAVRPVNVSFKPARSPGVWLSVRRTLADALYARPRPEGDGEGGGKDEFVDDFDLSLFCDFFFLYDSKSLKTETQQHRRLSVYIRDFTREQGQLYPMVYSSAGQEGRQYINVTSEISALPDHHHRHGSTLLARRCYVYNTASVIFNGSAAGPTLFAPGRTKMGMGITATRRRRMTTAATREGVRAARVADRDRHRRHRYRRRGSDRPDCRGRCRPSSPSTSSTIPSS